MSESDIAVRVSGLSKYFAIYDKPHHRLLQSLMPRLRRAASPLLRPFTGRAPAPRAYHREFWALRDVSFEVRRGETVGIIGRNGSGKSTLLQIVCGTLAPSGGRVEVNGRVAALLELGSGFNPEFTGRENVYLNGAVLGLSGHEIRERFDAIAAFADIGDFMDQPVKTYSSGMAVRLAFAVAIHVDAKILVVDEALSVGDERFQRKCFARLEALKRGGATILFVSHAGGTVVELCDRAVLLDAGELLTVGTPKDTVAKYQKLLYAPDDRRGAVRDEIRMSNRLSAPVGEQPFPRLAVIAPGSDEFFDPNLQPQSTVSYASHGARIEAPEILALSGERVNCLKRGRSYRYTYRVRFERAATDVRFGMLIKTPTGVELGGAVSAHGTGRALPFVPAGAEVRVEFRFSCALNPGTYFLNAGVAGSAGAEDTYLHRLLDACMFKVLPLGEDLNTGLVDFDCTAQVGVAETAPVLAEGM